MKSVILYCATTLLLFGCQKSIDALVDKQASVQVNTSYTKYLIKKGQHFTEQNIFSPVEMEALKFIVRFDSSAVYKTVSAENQYDINKLYGFADNNGHHHQFSARFGWRWSDGALRLFAYIYNNGSVAVKELGTVNIGAEAMCSITITATEYIFTLNEYSTALPRLSNTSKAKGYLLYPYFGGDESAPHDVTIWIKNI